ncbi:MAG: T9SS type A sorting domain-containing protein [candidate division WOR-3 bacterium]
MRIFFLFLPIFLCAQNFIANSDLPFATGMSNGAKIFSKGIYSETLHCVFQKSDGIYYGRSVNLGVNWTTQFLYPGRNPSIFVSENGYRHVVWEKDTAGNSEIYYYCLDIRSPPVNISQTLGKSYLPVIAVDTYPYGIHIVWADSSFGPSRIYYRSLLGDTYQISVFAPGQDHSYPTIGLFEGRLYVFWQAYSPTTLFPYRLYARYLERDTWSSPIVLDSSANPLLHPSCDFTGYEGFSLGYEKYTSGNIDCVFLGGNGGGYSTPGRSTYPTLSTIGSTWSYLAWMEDEADISLHFYYFMMGWYFRHSLRQFLPINERVKYPNFFGAHLLWTQGDSSPYSIRHHFFGYPIGINEEKSRKARSFLITYSLSLLYLPEPFHFAIYDITGKKVSQGFSPDGELLLNSKFKTGIYFIRIRDSGGRRDVKVTVLN